MSFKLRNIPGGKRCAGARVDLLVFGPVSDEGSGSDQPTHLHLEFGTIEHGGERNPFLSIVLDQHDAKMLRNGLNILAKQLPSFFGANKADD